jgi:hypothetical protein
MALSPAEIHKTLSAAEHLNQQGNSTQAFILAWTVSKAYNYRFILAALQMQGLSQTSDKDVLRALHSHQFKNMNRIRNRLRLDKPTAAESVTHVWHQLEFNRHKRTYRERRNGLVHGNASADPRILRRGVELILESLKGVELLETLRARIRFGDTAGTTAVVGKVLIPSRPKVGSRSGTARPSEMMDWLR